MDTLLALDQITADQDSLVGSRAFQLSLLAHKEYAVIPSFVVSAECFQEFLSAINWLEPFFADLANSTLRLNLADSQQLQTIAQQIRTAILTTPFPAAWQAELERSTKPFAHFSEAAVLHPSIALQFSEGIARSAAQKPFNLENLLEPQICWRDAESLANSIKVLWAELFRARNMLYWQKANLSLQQFHFAILVQAVPSPVCSGYLQFNGTTWDVLATPGLEIAIAQGEVMPDLYRLDAHTGITQFQKQGSHAVTYDITTDRQSLSPLLRKTQANRQIQSLSQEQLQQIHQLIQQLSLDFSVPMSLTWQMHATQIYLTQIEDRKGAAIELPPSAVEEVAGIGAAPGQVIAIAKVLSTGDPIPQTLPPGTVLIAETIPPDWLPILKQASAIVSEQGGITSHGAIVARELGIPAIVNARNATQQFQTGDRLHIDGNTGKISPRLPVPLSPRPSVSSSPMSPIATHLLLTLSQPEQLDRAAALPVDGIGLLRSELMLLTLLEHHPSKTWLKDRREEFVEKLATQIQQFAQAFAPRPVFYRSLDLRSHEFRSLMGDTPAEPNPMLGIRGTFSYTLNPELFDLELAALHQVDQSNLRLLLPFVRTVEEFTFCQQRVQQTGLNLPLWIMAEVPSVVFLLSEYVKAGVQGICIGTNDLTQLLLGADRDQGVMAKFDANHPAVKAAIAQLIQSAQSLEIPASICYPATAPIEFVDFLVQLGVDSISVNVDAVEAMYRAIARAEQRLLLKKARDTRGN